MIKDNLDFYIYYNWFDNNIDIYVFTIWINSAKFYKPIIKKSEISMTNWVKYIDSIKIFINIFQAGQKTANIILKKSKPKWQLKTINVAGLWKNSPNFYKSFVE